MTSASGADDPFVVHRSLLFTVAYELLGSAADAEDVLQESWLRWASVDQSQVRDPRAYLVRIVTRQALNHLRTVARRREDYVGEWLPEPLLTSPDVADDVELAENVSIAMLTVLETLGPAERAVFVLREVFDMPYDEIAEARRQVAGSRSADRASRQGPRLRAAPEGARRPLRARRGGGPAGRRTQHRRPAGAHGRPGARRGVGRRRRRQGPRRCAAARSSERTGSRATSWAGWRRSTGVLCASATWVNGQRGIRMELDGQLVGIVSLTVENGRVTRVYSIANPDKLGRLDDRGHP